MLTRTIDHYREETKETLVFACRLFGVNRQVYYRQKRAIKKKQDTASLVVERVNGILKQEFLLEDYDLKLPVMKELVKNSIEIYNKKRPHYSCHMKTPEQMHGQDQIKIRTYKKTNRIRANLDTVS
jgi:hypothetical protein